MSGQFDSSMLGPDRESRRTPDKAANATEGARGFLKKVASARPSCPGGPSRETLVAQLQRSYGNATVQRMIANGSAEQGTESEDLARRIESASVGGSQLEAGVQRQLEQGLGAGLSSVRLHTDAEADHLAHSVDATAFTSGQHIFFRSDAFNPDSPDGLHLLAHEAAHTVQQSAGPVAGTPAVGGVSVSDPGDAFEQAASQAATAVQRQISSEDEDLRKKKIEEEQEPT